MKFRTQPHVELVLVGNQAVAFNNSDSTCHILNETAGWLLSLAQDSISVDRAVTLASEVYDPTPDLRPEISKFISELETLGLIGALPGETEDHPNQPPRHETSR